MFKNPPPGPTKALGMPADVQIRFATPFLKERLDEGRGMRRGQENALGDRDVDLFFIENEEGRGDSSLPSG